MKPGNQPAKDRNSDSDVPTCEHCRKLGHTKATCWDIIGKPAGWKSRAERRGRANAAVAGQVRAEEGQTTNPFTQDQVVALQQLLSQVMGSSQSPPNTAETYTSLFANRGNHPYACLVKSKNFEPWILDSGCSDHMTGSKAEFQEFQPCSRMSGVRVADGSIAPVTGIGRVQLTANIQLSPLLYVPNLNCNLVSISQLTKDLHCKAVFGKYDCELQEEISGRTIAKSELENALYIIKGEDLESGAGKGGVKTALISSRDSIESQVMLWHTRLGHPSFGYLEKLLPKLFLNKKANFYQCETCQLAKHTRNMYSSVNYKPTQPFSIVHSDVWGPTKVKNLNGARWFITFIDDHTRITWTYLMKDKSETSQLFKEFHAMVKTQFHTNILVLRTDNARDYFNSVMGNYLSQEGIIHCSSCVDTPQQNGIAERKNRHLLDTARALMFTNQVPKYLWGEAVLTATYLVNRLPSRVLQYKTPKDVLLAAHPHVRAYISDLEPKVFGCMAFVHIQQHQRTKLDPRAQKCVFIGYGSHQKGYKCYSPGTKKIFVTMDVTFFEQQSFFPRPDIQGGNLLGETESHNWEDLILRDDGERTLDDHQVLPPPVLPIPPSNPLVHDSVEASNRPNQNNTLQVYQRRQPGEAGRIFEIERTDVEATQPITEEAAPQSSPEVEDDLDKPIALRKGVRGCTLHPIEKQVSYGQLSHHYRAFITELDKEKIPSNVREALINPKWKMAVMDEIKALEKNKTWKIVELPGGKKTVDCKWIFTIKYNSDGSIERYKARLVARGFTQSYGIDYQETFAPVAKLNTVRVLLSLAVNEDWPLFQMDVKNAFLNGDLAEEVYMTIPEGVNHGGKGGLNPVCKLEKALYGLKQSPRAWFEKFANTVKSEGYYQCQTDHTMFVRHRDRGRLTILIVYVDDIIVTGSDKEEICRLKKKLAEEFELKDLGEMRYFLGMEIARSDKGLIMSQRKYVIDLLTETGMLGCKPAETPMLPNVKFDKTGEAKLADRGRYQQLVGKLIYLSHTRPDITYAVGLVSQFMHEPTEEHWEAVLRILRYLKRTPGLGLMFRKHGSRNIELYTDASWASSITDRKSTSGYCSYVWGNLVTWKSKKQSVVARSSAEAEYRSLALGICEGIWLRRVLDELKAQVHQPIHMFCDSQAAISIVKNPVHHDRTKHVEIDRHFISENANQGVIEVSYIPTGQQTADMFTKAVPPDLLERFKSNLGLHNIYTKIEGECREYTPNLAVN
ncbi:Retrovirus-related Pol polyprotein from transposon TNT 1-94 [Linum perenne]